MPHSFLFEVFGINFATGVDWRWKSSRPETEMVFLIQGGSTLCLKYCKTFAFLLISQLLIPHLSHLFFITVCSSFTIHISTILLKDILTLMYSLIPFLHFWSSSKSYQKVETDKNPIFNWQSKYWKALSLKWKFKGHIIVYQETNINRENKCPHEVVTKNQSKAVFYYFFNEPSVIRESKKTTDIKMQINSIKYWCFSKVSSRWFLSFLRLKIIWWNFKNYLLKVILMLKSNSASNTNIKKYTI